MPQIISILIAASLTVQSPDGTGSTQNQLTAPEQAAGWRLLFDGRTLDGWRGYRRDTPPEAGWEVKDGTLRTVANVKGADLVTRQTFNDFEFAWEWRLAPGGNNGVKYFVTEARPQSPGHEYQMIDDAGYTGTLHANQHTADFYDVLPAAADKPVRPGGEWNSSRIVVRGTRVEHWLNGRNVLTYELGSPRGRGRHRQKQVQRPSGLRREDRRAHHADVPPGRMLVPQPEDPRAQLIELNRRIVERLQLLRSTRSLARLAEFSVGMVVEFDTDDGRTAAGPSRV